MCLITSDIIFKRTNINIKEHIFMLGAHVRVTASTGERAVKDEGWGHTNRPQSNVFCLDL